MSYTTPKRISSLFLLSTCSFLASIPIQANATQPTKQTGTVNKKNTTKKDQPNEKNNLPVPKTQSQLEAENAFNRALLEQRLSKLFATIERLRLEKEHKRLFKEIAEEEAQIKHRRSIQQLQMEKEKLVAEAELEQAKLSKQMKSSTILGIQLERKVQLEKLNVQLLQERKNRLQAEIDALQMDQNRAKYLTKDPIYLTDPLRKKDNVLVLSERCIKLDLVIVPWTANRIIDEIQYFNNKSIKYPIFLVIDTCYGGAVSAGFDILQAMKASQAPVYVVVKRFAASMAAMITSLATKSYVYPNAEILHHQPSAFSFELNVREKKEGYERLLTLWQRLGGALAKKMGIPLQILDKKLYEKSMDGDWVEYGDKAKKIKWVDTVINGVDDSALRTCPNPSDYTLKKYIEKSPFYYSNSSDIDQHGLSPEEKQYYKMNPHDFDYSCRVRKVAVH